MLLDVATSGVRTADASSAAAMSERRMGVFMTRLLMRR
jgi:hypothetical protein